MAEDRFANVFTAEVVMTALNTNTFAEMQFGISLRDRIAIVIDEVYFYPSNATIALMTATGDNLQMILTVSDQVSTFNDLADRRILFNKQLLRHDLGTAAGGVMMDLPLKESFSPPIIQLPNRIYFGMTSGGLASAGAATLRMHYRTVKITEGQQLIEVLESFQLNT